MKNCCGLLRKLELYLVSGVPLAGHIEGVKAEKGPPLHGAVSASPSGLSPPKRPTDERCRPSSFNRVFRVKFELSKYNVFILKYTGCFILKLTKLKGSKWWKNLNEISLVIHRIQ